MTPTFFPTQAEFREWLANNHDKQQELLVGFYKVGSGKPSMTWSESVDQALCFGWIDGVRRSYDGNSYTVRFTPRKPNSIWSAVNIQKVDELTRQGLMQPTGLAAYAKRQEHKSKIYAYEQDDVRFSTEFEQTFKAQDKAWAFFEKQAPWYRKVMMNWVMSAKQAATRQSRLDKLIAYSAEGKRI